MGKKKTNPLRVYHKFSSNNLESLSVSLIAGCFHCLETYYPAQVKSWTDRNSTALCPYCGVDAVLGSAAAPLSKTLLQDMHAYWFEKTYSENVSALKDCISYEVRIDCDLCGHAGLIVGGKTPRKLAAEIFGEDGWVVKDSKVHCPYHTAPAETERQIPQGDCSV